VEKKILQSQALVANSAWQSGVAAAAATAAAVRGVLMQAILLLVRSAQARMIKVHTVKCDYSTTLYTRTTTVLLRAKGSSILLHSAEVRATASE
jgi:hypothetical protein